MENHLSETVLKLAELTGRFAEKTNSAPELGNEVFYNEVLEKIVPELESLTKKLKKDAEFMLAMAKASSKVKNQFR